MSEEVRDRERAHFQHLLDYNRLLASAVSHEIRNLCSAISVVCSNLGTRSELRGNADFDALTRLVSGLTELASLDLRATSAGEERTTDLKAVLDHLRVVIEPDWDEVGGAIHWQVPETLPAVAANAHGLLQIFLNLCQNSLRAVETRPDPRLVVSVQADGDDAVVTFTDNGPGVTNPEALFHLHPVRPDGVRADDASAPGGAGLGLYISRELARSVGGDLRYAGSSDGARFQVVVPLVRDHVAETSRAS
jgi:signal transduction histidine kinase